MEEFTFFISSLEAEVEKGKSYVLCEPVYDSNAKLLLGTQKILTMRDVAKLREIYNNDTRKTIHVRTVIPHYIDEDKRTKWADYAVAFFKKAPYAKKITHERCEFIEKYLGRILRESDYSVWKLSQLKTFSKKIFENSLHTCYIALLTYYNYALSTNSGMIDGRTVENIINASMLHNIGLLKIEAKHLDMKRVEMTLNKQEFYQHPVEAYRLLKSETDRHDLPEEVMQAVLNHEEFLDGSGYPRGLSGEDLPFLARLISLSNYAALLLSGEWSIKNRSDREHYMKLRQDRNKFDPELFDALDAGFKTLF